MIQPLIAACAFGIIIGTAGAWTAQAWRYSAKISDIEREHENTRANQISISARDYRRWVDRQSKLEKTHIEFMEIERVKHQTVVKTIEKLVERPVYHNVCIDSDGMLIIANTIAGKNPNGNPTHPPNTGPAMPKTIAPD